jgi:hypothetical protein
MRRRQDDLEPVDLVLGKIERAIRLDVGLDSFQHAERAGELAVDVVDLAMLRRRRVHGHAARNRQSVRMVRDRQVRVAARQRRRGQRRHRLPAVAPGRVHLQVSAIVGQRWTAPSAIADRRNHCRTAEEVAAERAPTARLLFLAPLGDGTIDGGRSAARLERFQNHAKRRWADSRDLRQRSAGRLQFRQLSLEIEDGARRSAVAPFALLDRLHRGKISQQAGNHSVDVDDGLRWPGRHVARPL